MNAPAAAVQSTALTPMERFKADVLPQDKALELFKSLPSHISPARFERNLVNALMQKPELMNYDPRLVYREVSKSVGLGLLLDPQLGEAYLVEAYNYKTKSKEPQLRIGYKGMCKLARQAGDVVNIYTHEVCANDHIRVLEGTAKSIEHEPDVFKDRGEIVGYYAVIKFDNGVFDFECMTVAQCQAIRDRSDGWKAYKSGAIKSTPWLTDEEEMSKKTVLRRLLKRQPQSPDLADAIGIEDAAEHSEMRSAPRLVESPPPIPAAAQAEAPLAIAHQSAVPMPIDLGRGELVGFGREEEAPEIEAKKLEPVAEVAQAIEEDTPPPISARLPTPKPAQGTLLDAGDIPEGLRRQKTPMETFNRPSTNDPKKFLAWLDARLTGISEAEAATLETVWNDEVAPFLDGLPPVDQEEAAFAYRHHEARLAP